MQFSTGVFMRSSLLLAFAAVSLPLAARARDPYVAAISAPGRPAEAVAIDPGRKPATVLAFLGLRRNMVAADIMTGSGYWAALMARVVAPGGAVDAYEPDAFKQGAEEQAAWAKLTAAAPHLTLVRYPWTGFAAPARRYDAVMISLNYHDLYWQSDKYHIPATDPAAFLKTLYAAVKPGGVVGVIDHVGLAGDTRAIVEKSHRIDPAVVKADFERAGFRFEAASDALRNPADPHTANVFDPAIRGKTDRFLFRFRKPG
jgi:predicted methyltransferase